MNFMVSFLRYCDDLVDFSKASNVVDRHVISNKSVLLHIPNQICYFDDSQGREVLQRHE